MSEEKTGVKGSFRLQITEGDKIVGDSGWLNNQITDEGFRNYLVRAVGALAGSAQVSHAAIGTGGAPAAAATTLAGEVVKRAAVTAASSSNSKAVQFTMTFSSANSFVTDTRNLSNIGLFNSSAAGILFAGNTFASSSCATNQDVSATYLVSFA